MKRMKRLISLFGIVVTSMAVTAGAEVNCKLVNHNLKTGRTPQDVAETMVISLDDVKKCQQEDKSGAGGGAAPATGPGGAAAPSGAAKPK